MKGITMNMKGLLYSAVAGLLIFASCDKSEMGPVISDNPTPPTIIAPAAGTSVEIAMDEFGNTLDFEWNAADFGFQAAVTYSVQVDVGNQDFAEPIELLKSEGLTGSITYESLNNKLLAAGAVAGAMNDLTFRVTAKVSNYVPVVNSEAVGFTVKPYFVEVSYPVLNVPGNYQGWAPDNMETVIHSLKSDEVYDGYVYFGEAAVEFKFAKGSWDANWGDDGADGTLEPDGANITAEGPAMYRLQADMNDLTYTTLRTDWGLIGSATAGGWDVDEKLIWDADAGVLTITTDLVAGEIKFRANDDWALNLGDDQANGIMEYEGANIVIDEAGNYTITLDLSGALYKYTVSKN